jgi:hypothetical protein
MTKPNSSDPLKDEQTTRFRNILQGDKDEETALRPVSPAPVRERPPKPVEPSPAPRRSGRTRLSAVKPTPETKTEMKTAGDAATGAGTRSGTTNRKERYKSAFWTVTGILSLLVDALLIAIVIILLFYVRRLNIQVKELMSLSSMPLDTVSGLYTNFEKMNDAHIITNIPFDTEIPVQFDLQINQQTEVILSQDTPINGARVTLTTGGLEISNAPANIILPAGTHLPIQLTLTVPVNRNVPVHLLVPVDIELATSELGVPFTGLMDVLEPLYCMLNPLAVDARGMLICEKARTP